MAYRISDTDEPQGVCLIKLFKRLDQFMDRDAHDPCGKFAFIECSVALNGRIMAMLLEDLENRWGPQEIVMWRTGRTDREWLLPE